MDKEAWDKLPLVASGYWMNGKFYPKKYHGYFEQAKKKAAKREKKYLDELIADSLTVSLDKKTVLKDRAKIDARIETLVSKKRDNEGEPVFRLISDGKHTSAELGGKSIGAGIEAISFTHDATNGGVKLNMTIDLGTFRYNEDGYFDTVAQKMKDRAAHNADA